MRILRFAPILAGLLIQCAPLMRVAQTAQAWASPLAWVFRWVAGATAVAGSMHGVSGASVNITSPKTARATNGLNFTYRIAVTSGKSPGSYQADPVPPGLSFNTRTGIMNGRPTEAGEYFIDLRAFHFSGFSGESTDGTLTLTVVENTAAPKITQHPQPLSIDAGQKAVFSVIATGQAPLTFQWIRNGIELAGKTEDSLAIDPVTEADEGEYSVRVRNTFGTLVSSSALLTVNISLVPPPVLTFGFAATNVNVGDPLVLQPNVAGASGTWQWFREASPLASQTNLSFSLASAALADAGAYRIVATTSGGSSTSAPVQVNVVAVMPPEISFSFSDTNIHSGEGFSLKPAITGTGGTWRWTLDGTNIADVAVPEIIVSNAVPSQSGIYQLIGTTAGGSRTSAPVKVQVVPLQLSLSGSEALGREIGFSSISGRSYRLETASTLSDTGWQPSGSTDFEGTGGVIKTNLPTANSVQGFWRLRLR